ncbi:MAG: YmdB family metallophosphoesterase, partial [Clostridia bacterium]|nr:YmdB family metallophosphoesterase [Clostridia bacterium]
MHLEKNLWKFREKNSVDFCVVNGENASFITGISPELAEKLLRSGA